MTPLSLREVVRRTSRFATHVEERLPGILNQRPLRWKRLDQPYIPLTIEDSPNGSGAAVAVAADDLLDALSTAVGARLETVPPHTELDNPLDGALAKALGCLSACSSNGGGDGISREVLFDKTRALAEQIRSDRSRLDNEARALAEGIQTHRIPRAEGVPLEYRGCGPETGKPMVLVNAYGIGHEIWGHFFRVFSQDRRVICPTQRPYAGTLGHAADLRDLLSALNIGRADFVCWCSGLKPLVELYRLASDRIRSITIISGYYEPLGTGQPRRTEYDRQLGEIARMAGKSPAITSALTGLTKALFGGAIAQFMGRDRRSALSASDMNDATLARVLREAAGYPRDLVGVPFSSSDRLMAFLHDVRDLHAHPIADALREIKAPTLVFEADLELVVPPESGSEGAALIPGAERVRLENSTHWCLWENAEEICDLVKSFVDHKAGSAAKRPGPAIGARPLFWLYNHFRPLLEEEKSKLSNRVGIDAGRHAPRDGYEILMEQREVLTRRIASLERVAERSRQRVAKNLALTARLAKQLARMRSTMRSTLDALDEAPAEQRLTVDDSWRQQLEALATRLGISKMGYCSMDQSLIFQGRRVPYPYAIVCIMEMKKEALASSPSAESEIEMARVYGELGGAINEIARWMRSTGITAQPSHPYRGAALYPAMAARANLGFIGYSGLLLTPEFGSRQRIGLIYTSVEGLPLAQENSHGWTLDYCASCNACVKACPPRAITGVPVPRDGGMYTTIDSSKCYPWFQVHHGCSICIKVCPLTW